MSEHMFGVTRAKLSAREVRRRDRIAKAAGAHGFNYTKDGQGHIGWFTGPNLGSPFDRDMARRVLGAIGHATTTL